MPPRGSPTHQPPLGSLSPTPQRPHKSAQHKQHLGLRGARVIREEGRIRSRKTPLQQVMHPRSFQTSTHTPLRAPVLRLSFRCRRVASQRIIAACDNREAMQAAPAVITTGLSVSGAGASDKLPEDQASGQGEEQLVLVASSNPAKVKAIQAALANCFPRASFRFQPVVVESGVRDQPWGSAETLLGAENRVRNARSQLPGSSLAVAIEGGVEWVTPAQGGSGTGANPGVEQELELHCFAWAVVAGAAAAGSLSRARSGSFLLPPALADLVSKGMELGAADDQVFKRTHSGRGTGTIGELTGGLITRQALYEHAVMLALVPFMRPELYPRLAPKPQQAGLLEPQPPTAAGQQ